MSGFAAMKRNAPSPLKKLYYSITPPTTTYKLARPTRLPAYDWQNTRVFSLPMDQYGWIRINLIGREAAGSTDEYEDLCSELAAMLSTLTSEVGEPIVNDVQRTAPDAETARVNPLPDLVIHWRDAAFLSSLKIKESNVVAERVSKKTTGQHSPLGFCIYRGAQDVGVNGQIAAKDLWRMIAASLGDSE
jgi:predicted AlkP superfamily phosphohydrolase/phosphomutase